MKKNIKCAALAAAILPATTGVSHAVVLAQYSFEGTGDATRLVATTVDPNITATDLDLSPAGSTLVPNLIGSSANGTGNQLGDPSNSGSIFVRTNAGTINSIDPSQSTAFLEFTLTVGALAPGDVVNITGFDYDIFATGGTFNYEIGLYSDLTGFNATDVISDANPRNGTGLDNASDDLSDEIALQGLTSGQTIDFRIYLGDNATNNNFITRLDDITIIGEIVSVPEPSSTALLGLGGLALLLRRRK